MTVDLAVATPTFLDLAGAAIPAGVDGRSFAPLLGSDPPPITAWRQSVFLEHAAEVPDTEPASRQQAPAGTLEPPDQLFTADTASLFTTVVSLAEKEGKHVELMAVQGTDSNAAIVEAAAMMAAVNAGL